MISGIAVTTAEARIFVWSSLNSPMKNCGHKGDRLHVRRLLEHQWHEVVVPGSDKGEDDDGGGDGAGEWDDQVPERAHGAGPVDPDSLEQLVGEAADEVAREQDGKGDLQSAQGAG